MSSGSLPLSRCTCPYFPEKLESTRLVLFPIQALPPTASVRTPYFLSSFLSLEAKYPCISHSHSLLPHAGPSSSLFIFLTFICPSGLLMSVASESFSGPVHARSKVTVPGPGTYSGLSSHSLSKHPCVFPQSTSHDPNEMLFLYLHSCPGVVVPPRQKLVFFISVCPMPGTALGTS